MRAESVVDRGARLPAARLFSAPLLAAPLLALALGVAPAAAQDGREERFFDWTRPEFAAGEYARRRAAVAARLAESGGGVLLVSSAHGLSHGETFRQADDFLYLTGLELPGSALMLDSGTGAAALFVPPRDLRFESPTRPNDFPGRPLGTDPELARVSGIGDVRPFETLESVLGELERGGRTLRFNPGRRGEIRRVETSLIPDWDPGLLSLYHLQQRRPRLRIQSAYDELARTRMVKGPAEIVALRRAADLTAGAIRLAASHVRDGVTERELEAAFEAACKRGGAQRVAFSSIVKSGPNSLWPWRILAAHYDRRNRAMSAGELVIFDVGCEVDHYVSDVGRTFPVSGRFTPAQREILAMEVAVADAIIAAVRPGVTFAALQAEADLAIPAEHRPFMQAGLFFGHHIGLATGDPSLEEAPLEPGMVFTVEPWYYNRDLGIAVFTEDVVRVTGTGAEVLTRGLPRTPDELERLVQGLP